MEKRWTFGMLAAGILIGWAIRGGVVSSGKAVGDAALPTKVERTRESGTARISQGPKIREMMRARGGGNVAELFGEIAAKDRLAALELMGMQVGPDGMNQQARMFLDQFLTKWAEEDFDGAWASMEGCQNEGLQRYMVNHLLQDLSNREPDRALVLYLERMAIDDQVSSMVPLNILRAKSGQGAAEFLATISKLPVSDMGSSMTEMQFGEGFDFQLLADGLVKLKAADKEYRPVAFPTNFLERWAATDVNAAHEWWVANGDVAHNRWSGILAAIEKSSDSAEAGRWGAERLQEAGKEREKMIESISNLDSIGLIGRVTPIADHLPDVESRDRFYIDVMKFNQYGDPLDRYGFAMAKLSSPEMRLQAMEEMARTTRLDLNKVSDGQFQAWGITRERAKAVIKGK